jgi:plasmid segregation protein ParM
VVADVAIIGLDIGFGFSKAVNSRDTIVFKSIFGEASDIQYREQMLGTPAIGEHLHVSIDGQDYFVGELAERHSNVRSFTLDQNQFVTEFVKVMALAAISNIAERKEPVRIVTGLPISYYRRHRDEIERILKGKHEVTLTDHMGQSQKAPVTVSHVRVIPQPFGSLFNQMLNNMGEVADKRFVQQKIGIIDIGFRTSDYTVADKTRYSERGSRTTESGIAKAFALIAGKLREMTGVNVEIYRLYDAVSKGSIKIRGKSIDLKPLTEQAFSKLATAIASDVDRLWMDDWDIDLMVITGGGGAVLGTYLQPLLQGEVLALDPSSDARLNNVRGYWKYGTNVWAKEQRAAEQA